MEFYLGFYEHIKDDLLKVVLESQKSVKFLGAINSTFIMLIPNKQKNNSFDDNILISCCNMIYKIIAKIISQRLKTILTKIVTEEQFGFLYNKQINDAVSLAQDTFHTMKKEKLKAFDLKLYLSK